VGIIGTGDNSRAIGTIEVVSTEKGDQNVYTYENKQNCHEFCEYILIKGEIAEKCEKTALDAWKGLGCRDAGRIDLRYDAHGVPNFLEVNPVAGLNPIDSDLPIICSKIGIPYNDLIRQIMDSAVQRIK
jgi:D-alanine-D-alanine ligase